MLNQLVLAHNLSKILVQKLKQNQHSIRIDNQLWQVHKLHDMISLKMPQEEEKEVGYRNRHNQPMSVLFLLKILLK